MHILLHTRELTMVDEPTFYHQSQSHARCYKNVNEFQSYACEIVRFLTVSQDPKFEQKLFSTHSKTPMVTFYPKITLVANCQHQSFKNDVYHFLGSKNDIWIYHYNITSPSRRTRRSVVILAQVIILGCKDLLASNCCALVHRATRIPYCLILLKESTIQYPSKKCPVIILL